MTDQATETGPLTVDAAIASLLPQPVEQEAPETEAPEAATEPEPTEPEGETSAPEEAEDGAETPAEGEEAEAVEPEAVAPAEPPRYWSKDAKDAFAKLPPELQAVVLEQEGPREEATAKAKAEAQRQIEAAQEELKGVRTLAEQLNTFLPEAIQTFQSRWGAKEPDWSQVADQYGADEAFKLKTRFETEQKQLATIAQANQAAQAEAHKAFIQTEWKTLAQIAPELAPDESDPKQGAETRQKVTSYLIERGIPKEAIAQISAVEMALAHDAMRWRDAQAALKAAPKPKPAASVARTPVRPAAAQVQPSSQRTAQAVAQRFAASRSVDDAVALLLARK
jgi:hypothetical protein